MNLNISENKAKIIGLLILLVVIIAITFNCTKSNPFKTNEDEKLWEQFLFQNTRLNFFSNGRTVNDKFYAVTEETVFIFKDFQIEPELIMLNSYRPGYDHKPLLTDNYVAYFSPTNNSSIGFRTFIQSVNNLAELGIWHLDEAYENYFFRRNANYRTVGATNDKNDFYSLILGEGNVCIVRANIDTSYIHNPKITEIDVFTTPSMENGNFKFGDMTYFKGNYYLSFFRGLDGKRHLIELSDEGIIRDLGDVTFNKVVNAFFEFQGYLFGILEGGGIANTVDGENWNYLGTIGAIVHDFRVIDDNYLFYYDVDQICCWVAENNSIYVYQLPTSNIAGRLITSINKFNDMLIITTSNGIFYADFEKVMKEKKLLTTSTFI